MEAPKPNPANVPGPAEPRRRIPMSVPQRKLEVPEIPGQHLYWFLDRNVARAIQAGYEFVDTKDVAATQFGVATHHSIQGSADLGSHVTVIGGTAESGEAEHLNLMKIKLEWWEEDQKVLEARNASIMAAIFRGEQIPGAAQPSPADQGLTYVKTALFNRPTRKSKT